MEKALPSLIVTFIITQTVSGQQVGIKSNALYWATITPNLSADIALGRKLTLDVAGVYKVGMPYK